MTKIATISVLFAVLMTACVSKKKYNQVENQKTALQEEISNLKSDSKECNENYAELEDEVMSYKQKIAQLQGDSENKIELTENGQVVSETTKANVRKVFSKMPADQRSKAKTLEDSINLAVGYNIKSNLLTQMKDEDKEADDAIEVSVAEPVVRITLTDKVLFKSGSYWVDKKAYNLLARIAEVINSEPNMDIRVEGHADNMKLSEKSYIVDNWDLSIRRAASVVRTLENKFEVGGDRLIASGRSHYYPVADNSTSEGRAKNRRTTILLLPKIDRYMEILNK
ncbi:OmpA/MotB family protein [Psychroflexus montanilacus]|uniref:OmpA/MotB family protein n=1 Tax=Psychroflexus montanilacus TaxID=2873598 RepID=UPI001CCAAAD8|nr:flagellar motor protein MotB [Psychroflexus montanilacus]MBZ9650494.1 flagellar motor protein MotB [Psychroflexus montanilacus]